MTAQDIWRAKTDDDLTLASTQLAEYSPAGQQIILSEIQRRGLDTSAEPNFDSGYWTESDEHGSNSALASHNLLSRLWNGEISLPVTYWIWGVVGNRVTFAAVLVAGDSFASPLFMVGVVACYLAYFVVTAVAIWRSSARYRGPRIWADLSRVSLGLGIFRVLAQILVY